MAVSQWTVIFVPIDLQRRKQRKTVAERVRSAINKNHRLTVRELEEDLGIPRILTEDLGMSRVIAKFVPRVLTEDQKNSRVKIAEDILESINKNPELLKRVITGDETWVYGYDPETKAQSSQWATREKSRPKKARQSQSNVKAMLTVFFDQEGVVHHEYAPQGRTTNKEYYLEVLKRLCDALKHPLKGKRFDNVEEIKRNVTRELLAITKKDFQDSFRKWVHR
ncbi:hypothetical protein DMN91_012326 [Ooceraea biroi]|uniref:Histone-lysine N-methyltransferase SETMAR n=1 Tax=Ooceraea biroi TaxID=2015173 RepID=A0A3L8D4A1_OOCBI|nr:hypothetical protein DMN91_012326 [Ooceraea biroi]